MNFNDDMTAAESIDLKSKLVNNPDKNPVRPLEYHCRTGHILPKSESKIQHLLDNLKKYCDTNEMKINENKCMTMLFNTSRNFDFLPNLSMLEDCPFEVVEEMKLLGVIISSDLSWHRNTDYICKKAYARLWILRRLKPMGIAREELLDVYFTQIRCVLEFAVPVWHSSITKHESEQLERVQKSAFAIILGQEYPGYTLALKNLKLTTLETRRDTLCEKFAENHTRMKNLKVGLPLTLKTM